MNDVIVVIDSDSIGPSNFRRLITSKKFLPSNFHQDNVGSLVSRATGPGGDFIVGSHFLMAGGATSLRRHAVKNNLAAAR